MFFKLTAKNPFRDLVRNARKVVTSDLSDEEKKRAFEDLLRLLKPKLYENELFLSSQTSFASRCEHWNQTDIKSIKPVTNMKNPWLAFKREFEHAVANSNNTSYNETVRSVSVALGWFYASEHKDDWLAQ